MERKITPKLVTTEQAQYIANDWNGSNDSGWEPFGDTVIVLPDTAAEKAGKLGLIYLADDQVERNQLAAESGIIVAVGDQAFDHISHEKFRPTPGMRVVFARYAGRVLKGEDGNLYRVMTDDCIAAVQRASKDESIHVAADEPGISYGFETEEALAAGVLHPVKEGTTVDRVTRKEVA